MLLTTVKQGVGSNILASVMENSSIMKNTTLVLLWSGTEGSSMHSPFTSHVFGVLPSVDTTNTIRRYHMTQNIPPQSSQPRSWRQGINASTYTYSKLVNWKPDDPTSDKKRLFYLTFSHVTLRRFDGIPWKLPPRTKPSALKSVCIFTLFQTPRLSSKIFSLGGQ